MFSPKPVLVLALLTAAAFAPPAGAADPVPAVRVEAVVIARGDTQSLQMKTRKVLVKVVNTRAKVLRAESARADPTTVLLTGLAPGVTRLTLMDAAGNEEKLVVIVEEPAF